MIQTNYCPDKFGTYLSHPEIMDSGIDLSDASVREIILTYRAYRQTLNPSFNNEHILRRVVHKPPKHVNFVAPERTNLLTNLPITL